MDLQQRQGSQALQGPGSSRVAANPVLEFQLGERAKQVDTLTQQLAFKEQEVMSTHLVWLQATLSHVMQNKPKASMHAE